MSEKALTLIRRAWLNQYTSLDLGCCDLEDFDFIDDGWIDKILQLAPPIETLILSNSWLDYRSKSADSTWNAEDSRLMSSENSGKRNHFRIIPEGIGYLQNLTVFICAGDGYSGFGISDISVLTGIVGLECIDLSNNKISSLPDIGRLRELKKLDLRNNKISEVDTLIPLIAREKNPMQIVSRTTFLKDGEINIAGNPIDDKLWDVINSGTLSILKHYSDLLPKYGVTLVKKPTMNYIRIFLASSSDLNEQRSKFEIFLSRESNALLAKNTALILEIWEDFFDGLSRTSKQNDYNMKIAECDIFVILYSKKVGKYSDEEFEIAHKSFLSTGKPIIFTYFMNQSVNIGSISKDDFESLNAFQSKLANLGHFQTIINNDAEFHLHFKKQLQKIYNL